MHRIRGHATYANVMATIAVFLALGGGSFALAALSKNSVKSKQIKDGAVKAQDIANGAVNGDKLAPNTITPSAIGTGAIGSSEIADNSLTGTDIDESSLQGVNAATAATAANADKVGGLEVKQVSFEVPVGTPIQSVLTYPGLFRIDAQCQNSGDGLDVSAATGVNGSLISRVAIRSEDGSTDNDSIVDLLTEQDSPFDINEVFPLDDSFPGLNSDQHVTVHFTTRTGFSATVNLALNESLSRCELIGTSVAG